MKFFTSYHLATASLKAHKTRTILTILGVVIGVFVITLVLLVGTGLRQSVSQQVEKLNDNVILVKSNTSASGGMEAFSPFRMPRATTLNAKDIESVEATPGTASTAPMMFLGGGIKGTENSYDNISIVATNANFATTFNLKISSGEFFDTTENDRNWVVLGSKLASGALGTNQVLGQKITLKGQEYIVVGILRQTDQPISLAGVDIDATAFISVASGRKFTNDQSQIGQIVTRADNPDNIDVVANGISAKVAKNHIDASDFSVVSARDAASVTTGWVDSITMAAAIFAGVSLLVGGIGIMNIMLVSVTERTREIGIRKAVGATKAKILQQFLFEALIMTIIGGIIGVALAYGAAYLIDLQFSLPLIFSWQIMLISLGIPLIVGVLFGIWPAWRAARQDPIVALRQYH